MEFNIELLNETELMLISKEEYGSGCIIPAQEIPAHLFKLAVHDGQFHADDVLCVVLMKLINPDLAWVRTRDPEILQGCIRMDVGEGLLDHHGSRAKPGIAACSHVSGLLQQSAMLGAPEKRVLDPIVNGVAAWDTGDASKPHPLPYLNDMAAAAAATDRNMDEAFAEAVDMCYKHLSALIAKARVEASDEKLVSKNIFAHRLASVLVFGPEGRRYSELKRDIWRAAQIGQGCALYYVSPETDADWRVFCCCPGEQEYSPFASIKLIPERFAGLRGDALAKAAGLAPGEAIFCHKDRFIAGFTTREAAVKFASLCAEAEDK